MLGVFILLFNKRKQKNPQRFRWLLIFHRSEKEEDSTEEYPSRNQGIR